MKRIVKKIKPKYAIPAAIVTLILALGLVVEASPLSEYATPEKIVALAKNFAGQPFAPLMMVGVIILSQAVLVPISVMTLATAMVFGPFEGIAISLTGALTSALLGFGLGHFLGEKGLRKYVGPTLKKIRGHLENGGIAGLIALRFVPVAPYTVMNITLGVLEIPFITFITASFLELLPGCAIRAFLGGAISELWRNPDATSIGIVAAGFAVWGLMVLGIHMGVKQWKKKRGHAAHAHHKLAHS
jgi:uncharacterized membrane protein YdjX (TVP38/TMEM64 family)